MAFDPENSQKEQIGITLCLYFMTRHLLSNGLSMGSRCVRGHKQKTPQKRPENDQNLIFHSIKISQVVFNWGHGIKWTFLWPKKSKTNNFFSL